MATKADKATPEGAVRLYLMALKDPTSLRDEAAIKAAQAKADKASDPIDRLRALAELRTAEAVDLSTFEAAFVSEARTFALAEGWSDDFATALFTQSGVPAYVLSNAGFDIGKARSKSTATKAKRSGGTRQPAPTEDETVAALPAEPFTVADLAAKLGRNEATARNALKPLLADGRVGAVGTAPKAEGARGKAATLYAKA